MAVNLNKRSDKWLADKVGELKAQAKDIEDELTKVKDVLVARATERSVEPPYRFQGLLFSAVLSPPTTSRRLSKDKLSAAFGAPFIAFFSETYEVDWSMTCYALSDTK